MTTSQDYTVFCDESGITSGPPCYSIGALVIPTERVDAFNKWFRKAHAEHGVQGEAKWTKVKGSHGLINFTLELFYWLIRHPQARLQLIVVRKELFNNWFADGPEAAFYQTYTHVVQHLARGASGSYRVVMDEKSDSYEKWSEVVEIIGNRMIGQRGGSGRIASVVKADSKAVPGLQAVDLITGAVNTAHIHYLDPEAKVHRGKLLAIERMADMLGWDGLHYDTGPNRVFNVWHFPKEYRCLPSSKWTIPNPLRPNYVSREELVQWCG